MRSNILFSIGSSHNATDKTQDITRHIKRLLNDWRTWLIIILGWGFFFYTVYIGPKSAGDSLRMLFLIYTGGLLAITWGFHRYHEKNLIETTPTSKIRSLALGECEVEGKVKPTAKNNVLIAPLTQRRCVYYSYDVMEERRRRVSTKSGIGRYNWRVIDSGKRWVPFLVEDDTGAVLVYPYEAIEEFDRDVSFSVSRGELPPPKINDFINRRRYLKPLHRTPGGARRRIYKETFIAPGDDVYVFGKAMERKANDNLGNVVIGKDDTTPLFRISDNSEKGLIEDYKKEMSKTLIGGAVAVLVSYGILLYALGLL